jgi:hypothetical protein
MSFREVASTEQHLEMIRNAKRETVQKEEYLVEIVDNYGISSRVYSLWAATGTRYSLRLHCGSLSS